MIPRVEDKTSIHGGGVQFGDEIVTERLEMLWTRTVTWINAFLG
jgi:hypothetical protein